MNPFVVLVPRTFFQETSIDGIAVHSPFGYELQIFMALGLPRYMMTWLAGLLTHEAGKATRASKYATSMRATRVRASFSFEVAIHDCSRLEGDLYSCKITSTDPYQDGSRTSTWMAGEPELPSKFPPVETYGCTNHLRIFWCERG